MVGRKKKIKVTEDAPELHKEFAELIIQQRQLRAVLLAHSKLDCSPVAYKKLVIFIDSLVKIQDQLERTVISIYEENSLLLEEVEELKTELKRRTNELRATMKFSSSKQEQDDDFEEVDPEEQAKAEKVTSTKKRGAPVGHLGKTRVVPHSFDDEAFIDSPKICPCGCDSIIQEGESDIKFIEDIAPIIKRVIRVNYQRGRCANCGRLVRHPDAISGPPTQIGPAYSTFLTLMRQAGLTYGQLEKISNGLKFPLTRSGILGIVNRTTDQFRWIYDIIGAKLGFEWWLNIDETSWKVNGIPWYIWVFCNDKLAYFHAVKSRGSKVLEEILGKKFKGIAICDFYAAYNVIEKTQRCLVHLLKDIKKEREVLKGNKQLKVFDRMVKKFINDGLDITKMKNSPEKKEKTEALRKYLDKITKLTPCKGRMKTLIKRISKYKDDIFRFVENVDIDYHNNRAERQLRPQVISRKMSFGSNTEAGALRNCILHSVIETCKLQKIEPMEFIEKVITNPDWRIIEEKLLQI